MLTRFPTFLAAAAIAATGLAAEAQPAGQPASAPAVRNVVLVHGAFADGAGWRGVHGELTRRGYRVTIVQNPLTSLADDVAATRRALAAQDGPVLLVGHSWGGTVITEAGAQPNVAGLVYVSALAPDAGQASADLYEGYPPASEFVIDTGPDGFGLLNRDRFKAGFAADLSDADAAFLRDSQVPFNMSAFATRLTQAAWRTRPSWAIIATEDRAFGAGMLHGMARRIGATIVEIPGSHAAYISQAPAVADAIDRAARSLGQPTR